MSAKSILLLVALIASILLVVVKLEGASFFRSELIANAVVLLLWMAQLAALSTHFMFKGKSTGLSFLLAFLLSFLSLTGVLIAWFLFGKRRTSPAST